MVRNELDTEEPNPCILAGWGYGGASCQFKCLLNYILNYIERMSDILNYSLKFKVGPTSIGVNFGESHENGGIYFEWLGVLIGRTLV